MVADDPILGKGDGPETLCKCGHRCDKHSMHDPGYCLVCKECKGFESTGLKFFGGYSKSKKGNTQVTVRTGESVTFAVEARLTRWQMFVSSIAPGYKGVIYAEKRLDIVSVQIRNGVPSVTLEEVPTTKEK